MARNPHALAKALMLANTPNNMPTDGGFGGVPSSNPGNGLSPMVASYDAWSNGRAYGRGLPRDWATFMSGSFGPLAPIQPVAVDAPDPETGRPEPRRFQYPVGWNMPMGPPGTEGLKLCTFPQLRTVAQTYSVARACIDLRKQELVGLQWDIVPTKAAEKKMRNNHSDRKAWDERRAKVMSFMRQPDPNYFSFASWLNAQLEDVLAIDAWTLYLHPSRRAGKGVMGSNLAALDVIDGSTIRPLLSITGGKPSPPNPAYQQYLYGVPRSDLTTVMSGADIIGMKDALVSEYRGDQLLYLPYDAMDWTPYGFSSIEKAIVPIMSGLNRQNWQLEYFSEGTVPGLFVSPGDTATTPAQIRELQDALNAMAGDPAWKHKIIVLPAGSKTNPMRDVELAGTFDEVITQQVCMAFGVMPMELGITPHASSSGHSGGAVNQMGKMSTDAQNRKANKPLLRRFMEVFDYVIQIVLKQDDMRFLFEGLEETEDESTAVALLVNEISHGLKSIDEGRIARGEQPWGFPITSDPVMMTATGIIPIGGLDPTTGQLPAPPPPPPLPGLPAGQAPAGQPALPPAPSSSAPPASAGQSTPSPAHSGAAAADAVNGQPPAPAGKAVNTFAALRELDAMRRRLNKGRSIDGWVPEHVPDDLFAGITDIDSIESVRQALRGDVTKHDGHADDVHHVYAYLARHYPANVLEWVKSAHWHGPVDLPLSDIDMARRPGGARNPAKVEGIKHAIADGMKLDPIVLVLTPAGGKYEIADGWHRTDALADSGRTTVSAWVGDVDTDDGPWGAQMNRAKLNKVHGLSPDEFVAAISKVDEGALGDYRARHLIRWFNAGADGAIDWGGPGDLSACHLIAAEHMDSDKAWGFCNLRHRDVLGVFNNPKD